MLKAQRTELIQNLSDELKGAQTILLVDYTGLNMASQQELKKRLKEVGAKMTVAKNTLLRIAGTQVKLDEQALTDSVLSGQTALVVSAGDPMAPIQVIGKFAKEFDVTQFKVGIVEGNY